MYTVRTGSGRDEPIETLVFLSDWEVGDWFFNAIKNQEIEPDGSDLPETIDMIDDTSEMEIEIYWGDLISHHAQMEIDAMWSDLTELWEDEGKQELYDAAILHWESRIYGLSA